MFAIIVAVAVHVVPVDCGQARYLKELRFTESLIVKRVALQDLVGEMPTRSGHPECVRFTFSIDAAGQARSITVEESSRDYLMTASAMRALAAYQFKPATVRVRHMLVFRALINKAPPFPDPVH